jgi:hypothetical protein
VRWPRGLRRRFAKAGSCGRVQKKGRRRRTYGVGQRPHDPSGGLSVAALERDEDPSCRRGERAAAPGGSPPTAPNAEHPRPARACRPPKITSPLRMPASAARPDGSTPVTTTPADVLTPSCFARSGVNGSTLTCHGGGRGESVASWCRRATLTHAGVECQQQAAARRLREVKCRHALRRSATAPSDGTALDGGLSAELLYDLPLRRRRPMTSGLPFARSVAADRARLRGAAGPALTPHRHSGCGTLTGQHAVQCSRP